MELVHCIYCSTSASKDISAADLEGILEQSRRKNAGLGLTGMLLYRNGSFFQVLEGDRPAVESLFETIAADPRHRRVTKIVLEPIAERAFAAWTMGYPKLSPRELANIPGLNDFFLHGESYMEIGEGRAKALLAAFKEERWRLSLT
jgi:acylphosphatase